MTEHATEHERIDELIHKVVEDRASDSDRDELATAMRDDPAVRRRYVAYTQMHAMLAWECAPAPLHGTHTAGIERPASADRDTGTPPSRRGATGGVVGRLNFWAALAACVAGAAIVGWQALSTRSAIDPAAPIARVTQSGAAQWRGDAQPVNVGDTVEPGVLQLTSGVTELTLRNGVVMVLEAPVKLELTDETRVSLRSGRVVAKVPQPAIGFTIDTPQASVIDLGTEFGVGVGPGDGTLVQVYDGEVVTETRRSAAPGDRRRHLTAGKAVQIADNATGNADVRDLAFAKERFVRRLPDLGEEAYEWLPPYARSRYDRMHIVPAPASVHVDGDLSDWDLSGRFDTHLREPYADDYYVEGAMMYDDAHLYIAAHVGDPAPMRSVIDPHLDPEMCWKGGSVQVRLSTDPAIGWPVRASSPIGQGRRTGRRSSPHDNSANIIHLTMWHHRPSARPCLMLSYGMDYRQTRVNPDPHRATGRRWRGAFRADPDGRGYTLEYAIPWELLNAATRPPRPGDELGVSWQVHWSGEDGRVWRGHLVEITRPNIEGLAFLRADMWGKAIYHERGDLPPGTVEPVPLDSSTDAGADRAPAPDPHTTTERLN